MIKTPAYQKQLKVPPPAASVLQSLQNIAVTSLLSNWVLFKVLEQEIRLQRLLRQQSLFPRSPSMSNTKLQDSCHNTTATVQPYFSSATTFVAPVHDLNKNSADESSPNSAPTTAAKRISPSPTHRQQAEGQKPKLSENRYNTALISQPGDEDEYRPNPAPTETAELVTPSPTHGQQVADHKPNRFRNNYDEALVAQPEGANACNSNPAPTKAVEKVTLSSTHRQQSADPKQKPSEYRYGAACVLQPVRYLPSSSKFDTRNMIHILRTRAAKQVTKVKEPANTLPCTQVNKKAALNTVTLPTVKRQHQPTSRRSLSGTSNYQPRLGYKKGAQNCRTQPQSAPKVHQCQPACPRSNIWKVEPPPKVTASNSSRNRS